jgi:hypothetical protein
MWAHQQSRAGGPAPVNNTRACTQNCSGEAYTYKSPHPPPHPHPHYLVPCMPVVIWAVTVSAGPGLVINFLVHISLPSSRSPAFSFSHTFTLSPPQCWVMVLPWCYYGVTMVSMVLPCH